MSRIQAIGILVGMIMLVAEAETPARAQTFAELKTALVDYSKADTEPGKACEALTTFKSKDGCGDSRHGSGTCILSSVRPARS
jgi:hypothetical protein